MMMANKYKLKFHIMSVEENAKRELEKAKETA